VITALTLAACGAPRSPETAPAVGARPFSFDPAEHGPGPLPEDVEETIRSLRPPPAQVDTPAVVAAPAKRDTSWTTTNGYRIQIFTSTTRELAEAEALKARERFPSDSVYILFQSPWHRVRVGDFATRQDAEEKIVEAKEKGYPDAFWVRSQIRVLNR